MKLLIITITSLCLIALCYSSIANVYVIIYATKDGKTGHAGIAIDNYQIETKNDKADTVKDGTVTYFDMWPEEDGFGVLNFSRGRQAKFYKLPNSIWPKPVTITSLYDYGLPHKEFYPSDAILMIPTSYATGIATIKYLDSLSSTIKLFNARFFNCSDFVCMALNHVLNIKVHAKEFIPFSFTTTPNKLCRSLTGKKGVVVIKSPGSKVKGSFVKEKILKKPKAKYFIVEG
jgi:hypothetical protein